MKIVNLKTEQLIPYINNPRHNDDAVDKVASSIKEFGFKVPIVINKDNVVVTGHTRLKAAKKLGIEEVPCIIADDLTDAQIKAFRIADNKVSEYAEWNKDLLKVELEQLEEMDFDLDELNIDYSDFDLDIGEDIEEIEPEEVEVPEVPEEPKTKLGDIYQLGNHRLMCGSSTNVDDIDKLMNGEKPTLIYTDPPYGMNAVSKSGVLSERYNGDIMNDDDNTTATECFNLVMNMYKGVKGVWWGANYYTECLPSSECWIVWDKNNGASDQTDCELAWANFRSVVRQFTMASEKTNRVHPTQKPVKLFQEIIKKFDKNNEFNDVLDLFGGSGSTLIACEQLNRKCYMMELDPRYVDVIIKRWEDYTGNKAVKLE